MKRQLLRLGAGGRGEEETRGRPQPGRCGLKAPSPTHLGAGREGMLRSSRAGEEHGEETGQGGW